MRYLKIYEAYSADDYQKALKSVKLMVQTGRSKEDILCFINKYYSDTARKIDNLRIMLDRIEKTYSQFWSYFFYNRRNVLVKKKGVEKYKSEYDNKKFYAFEPEYKKSLLDFLSLQEEIYHKNIDEINDIDVTVLKFLLNKLFEILNWVNETGDKKSEIRRTRYTTQKSDEDIIRDIESYNNMDFENEVEEVTKIIKRARVQIKTILSSQ